MQPDYSKMAQQPTQQAPEADKEQIIAAMQKRQEEAGLPSGGTEEDAKKRILAILENAGVLKKLNPAGLQQLTAKIEEFIELFKKQDGEGLKNHPITKLLNKIEEDSMQQQQAPQAEPQQGGAPKDFASMMPPGGGMSGR